MKECIHFHPTCHMRLVLVPSLLDQKYEKIVQCLGKIGNQEGVDDFDLTAGG